jgi:hypothetical protein
MAAEEEEEAAACTAEAAAEPAPFPQPQEGSTQPGLGEAAQGVPRWCRQAGPCLRAAPRWRLR